MLLLDSARLSAAVFHEGVGCFEQTAIVKSLSKTSDATAIGTTVMRVSVSGCVALVRLST